jgi:hypothetical protein
VPLLTYDLAPVSSDHLEAPLQQQQLQLPLTVCTSAWPINFVHITLAYLHHHPTIALGSLDIVQLGTLRPAEHKSAQCHVTLA